MDLTAPRAATILARIRTIPAGRVTTYGDLSPGAPRFTGTVLAACDDPELPWWRVVRADGSLARGDRQARRLRGEGVDIERGRVDLHRVWVPAPPAD